MQLVLSMSSFRERQIYVTESSVRLVRSSTLLTLVGRWIFHVQDASKDASSWICWEAGQTRIIMRLEMEPAPRSGTVRSEQGRCQGQYSNQLVSPRLGSPHNCRRMAGLVYPKADSTSSEAQSPTLYKHRSSSLQTPFSSPLHQ